MEEDHRQALLDLIDKISEMCSQILDLDDDPRQGFAEKIQGHALTAVRELNSGGDAESHLYEIDCLIDLMSGLGVFNESCLCPNSDIGPEEFRKISQWNLAEAVAAQKEYDKENRQANVGRGPLSYWSDIRILNSLYEEYLSGDKDAIMRALTTCIFSGLPLPAWLSSALIDSINKVRCYTAKSWDDVLGRPHSKGTNLVAKRKKLLKSFQVYQKITEIKEVTPKVPIDAGLFETVGRIFGLGKTLAEEYYYHTKKSINVTRKTDLEN